LRSHITGIEVSDFANARLSCDDVLPDRGDSYTERGNNPQTGDDDSTFRQADSANGK